MSELDKQTQNPAVSDETPSAADSIKQRASLSGEGSPSVTLPEKRGRGRPRKDGSSPAPTVAKRNAAIDPELAGVIVTTLVQLVRLGDDVLAKSLLTRIKAKLPVDVQPVFAQAVKDAAFSERDEKILTPVLSAVVMKYDIFARMGPEALALLWVAQYGIRMAAVNSAIGDAVKKLSEKKPTPSDN